MKSNNSCKVCNYYYINPHNISLCMNRDMTIEERSEQKLWNPKPTDGCVYFTQARPLDVLLRRPDERYEI